MFVPCRQVLNSIALIAMGGPERRRAEGLTNPATRGSASQTAGTSHGACVFMCACATLSSVGIAHAERPQQAASAALRRRRRRSGQAFQAWSASRTNNLPSAQPVSTGFHGANSSLSDEPHKREPRPPVFRCAPTRNRAQRRRLRVFEKNLIRRFFSLDTRVIHAHNIIDEPGVNSLAWRESDVSCLWRQQRVATTEGASLRTVVRTLRLFFTKYPGIVVRAADAARCGLV